MGVLAHYLTSKVPTVAAINGHCYAGGFLFALSHDFRIMRYWVFFRFQGMLSEEPLDLTFQFCFTSIRQDRGFCCMNEIDIGFPLCPGMCVFPSHSVSCPYFSLLDFIPLPLVLVIPGLGIPQGGSAQNQTIEANSQGCCAAWQALQCF